MNDIVKDVETIALHKLDDHFNTVAELVALLEWKEALLVEEGWFDITIEFDFPYEFGCELNFNGSRELTDFQQKMKNERQAAQAIRYEEEQRKLYESLKEKFEEEP